MIKRGDKHTKSKRPPGVLRLTAAAALIATEASFVGDVIYRDLYLHLAHLPGRTLT